MYLHLGQSVAVPHREILGIFDLPRSFVLVGEEKGTATVYISQLSSAALLRRAESNLL